MDTQALRNLMAERGLDTEPDPVVVADTLNAPTVERDRPGERVGEGGILRILGPFAGHDALLALESAAETDPLVARVLRLIRVHGIDLADPNTRGMIAHFVSMGLISQPHADALIASSVETVSIASAAGLGVVGVEHVRRAHMNED